MKKTKYKFALSVIFLMVVCLGFSNIVEGMQIAGDVSSRSGWFSIIWGDSKDGKTSMSYTLTDVNGQRTLLQLDETVARKLGGVLQFNGKYVSVQGTLATPISGSTQSSPAVLNVISISLAPSPGSQAPAINGATALAVVSGSRPWVTIMCKFSDIAAEPNDRAYFLGMYGDTKPGLNHYWMELSFNTADVTGSTVGPSWYTLPETELHYNPTNTEKGTNLNELAEDCIAEADADVDFSLYSGINMMFNSDFDNGWAWGGSRTYTLDGVTKTWSTTWEPPWSYANISVISHEMGHGFGLPHSTAIDRDPDYVYDNVWDVMSKDRYNCAAATDPTYGCMAQHTIAYHKDKLGWIPGPQKTTVAVGASATITLEDLAAPASTNYQMVTIPIGGSATNFYTVEARRFTGYDAKLPAEAVIIHNVDTTQGIPALLVPEGLSSTDPGAMWTAGETFTDATNHITVQVKSATATGFEATISNGSVPPTSEAGGPYTQECTGLATTVVLDGSGSSDPDPGDTLTYSWSTTCPGGSFDDPTGATPKLTVDTSPGCSVDCSVTLIVTDSTGLSDDDTASVTISDTLPPQVSVTNPSANVAVQDGVTFKASASDNCGSVEKVFFSVREPDGPEGIPIGYEDLPATFNTGSWEYPFNTTVLQDGYYVIMAKAIDSCGNEGWSAVVPFSIRNWAVITMLPATPNNKAGRTMPVKFSIRIAASVDPAMPFVYNEDLEIRIYRCNNVSCSSKTLMQTSTYGIGSKNYRINGEMYITNFQTTKTPAQYLVEIWRPTKNFLVGSFAFKTVK